ncbi:Cytochrome P450 705A5, partial [Cucurbita argyrosperma subsp. sororia]
MADYILYFLLFFLSCLFLLFLLHKTSGSASSSSSAAAAKLTLPPSPPSLPLIGHLHLLLPANYKSFFNISSKYGPLLHIRLCSLQYVLVSSASLAAEIFRTHDLTFSSRPDFAFSEEYPYGKVGFLGAPYGDYWRYMKKLTMMEVLAPPQLARSRFVRNEEISRMLHKLLLSSQKKESVDLGAELVKLTNNSICRMMMSTRCSEENNEAENIRKLVNDTIEIATKLAFGDLFSEGPLKRLPFWLFGKKVLKLNIRFDVLLEKILQQHEERAKIHGFERDDRDLMDILLRAYLDEKAEFKITRNHIKAFLLDLFIAGTGTSAEVMQWTIAELINHPNVFRKVRQEIEYVVGSRLVEETDIVNLPYMQAVVKECLRLYPAVPVARRACRETCKVNGYDIPKDIMVAVDLFAIMRDPNLWENPDEFRPERFYNANPNKDEGDQGMKHIQYEIKGQNFSFVPFGGGRRGCPGSLLAYNTINRTVAALVQCFDWKVGKDGNGEKVNMEIGTGISLPMAHAFICVPVSHSTPFVA